MNELRLLWGFVRRSFLVWFAWRSFAFTLVVNQSITPLLGMAIWKVALPDTNTSPYFISLLLVRMLTVSYENHTLSSRIYSGEIADDLLRPSPAILQPLGENVAIRIWHLIIAMPLIMGLMLFSSSPLQWENMLMAAPFIVMAAAMRFMLTFSLALAAFWTDRADNAVSFGNTLIFLLGGEAVPFALLPLSLGRFTALLPFRAMSGLPAEILSGSFPPEMLAAGFWTAFMWLAVLSMTALAVWRAGTRKYCVVGG